jgi:glycerophosphoryl diester phosphodiesterase
LHDNTIDRTSNGTGNVRNFTFAQLQAFDFGSWFNAAYSGTNIPRLVDVARLIVSYGAMVGVSLHGNLSSTGYDSLYSELKTVGALGSLMLKTPYLSEYDAVYSRFGNEAEYVIYFGNLPTESQIAEIADRCGVGTTVEFSESYITQELVNYAKSLGLKVSVYFGNEPAMMKQQFLMGVNRFTVDTFSDIVIPR